MIFSESYRGHKIVIDSYTKADEAYRWCAENVPFLEWTVVQEENGEMFYFEKDGYAQNFLLMFGGRYYKHGG